MRKVNGLLLFPLKLIVISVAVCAPLLVLLEEMCVCFVLFSYKYVDTHSYLVNVEGVVNAHW